MKKIILILFLSILYQAHAQVPGYMGLKCSLQYQGGISPQWDNLFQSLAPYYSNNIQMGYVVSRKYEIGLQYTRIDYSSGLQKGTDVQYDQVTQTLPPTINIDHRTFTGNNLTAYLKFFRQKKGFLAPLGRYFILGLGYENSKDRFHVTSDGYSPIGVPNYTNVVSHDMVFSMGVGRNIILADRMLLTIEGDVNIPLTAGFRALINGQNGDGYGAGNSITESPNFYKRVNATDVMLVNLIQIKIGLGALLF